MTVCNQSHWYKSFERKQ